MSENGGNVENEFKKTKKMVHSTGFEPTTYCSGGNRSIQLSYECIQSIYTILSKMQMAKIKNCKILVPEKNGGLRGIRRYTEIYGGSHRRPLPHFLLIEKNSRIFQSSSVFLRFSLQIHPTPFMNVFSLSLYKIYIR